MKTREWILAAALGAGLSGCAMGPDYERPEMVTPATFRGQDAPDGSTIADVPWWEVFKDPTLQSLIKEAQRNNYDIRIAASRVEQARSLAAQATAPLYPSVNYGAGVSRGRNQAGGSANYDGGAVTDDAFAGLSAAWEIDVWGRIRRSNEAARARYLASLEAQNGVIASLVSDVATAYFELLELDLEKQIAVDSTKSFERSLKLFQDQQSVGRASKLDVARAQAALSATAANIPELERQIAVKENQIQILLGHEPAPVERSSTLLGQAVIPDVPVGVPSILLRRRPDVRQAEQNMIAANAEVGEAVANFFPKIGLTALLGRVSPELDAFTLGTGNLWSVAATLSGPLFEGGALRAQHAQAKAAYKEAELQWERTVLVSFQDVANALVTREKLKSIREEQEKSVAAYQEAVRLSTERYKSGKADYFEVIDAQQQLFPAQTTLARIQLSQQTVIVQLYRALGGGWDDENKEQEKSREAEGGGKGTKVTGAEPAAAPVARVP